MHRIRLRGPWELLSREETNLNADDPQKVRLPASWQLAVGGATKTRIARRFGCPAELESEERIWLAVQSELTGDLALNGDRIASICFGTQRFDVTDRLHDRNRIVLELIRKADQKDPPLPEVWLEFGVEGTEV